MSNPERLKVILAQAKEDVEKMDAWMKYQEPTPGDSYEDWIADSQETRGRDIGKVGMLV